MNGIDSAMTVRPRPGTVSGGDTAVVRRDDRCLMAVIIDVLGHGEEAREVAARAEEYLATVSLDSPLRVMVGLDQHLRGTRGAAVGIAMVELLTGQLSYAGIGNTMLRRFGDREQQLTSRPGVVGEMRRPAKEERLELTGGDVVLMYTDGVREHFSLRDYPGMLGHEPGTIAATVVRRFGKDHDDAACLALRSGG